MTERGAIVGFTGSERLDHLSSERSLLRSWVCLIAVVMATMTVSPVFAQGTRNLLNDAKVVVSEFKLSPGQTYTLPRNQFGTVWVALDPLILSQTEQGKQIEKQVAPGDAATASASEQASFRAGDGLSARLIVVSPKEIQQELTVAPFVFANGLEDASDRNATLLVAITDSRFRDTRNRGDESEWIPGKPDIVTMKSGEVRWIHPGIHHFKNLGPTAARLVSIEW